MKTRRPFRFKQFEVAQSKGCMPVTTDACIFGATIDLGNAKNILDIGTGTGLLSLMLAQRFPDGFFTAIDIDEESTRQANANFNNSPWKNRLNAMTADIRNREPEITYDAIVCNPPFFDNQLPSISDEKRRARHTVTLNYETLLKKIYSLLNNEGKCWLLIPALHSNYIAELATSTKLFNYHKINIRSFEHSEPHVIIFILTKSPADIFYNDFTIYNNPEIYSEEMKFLMKDYYLLK